MWAMNTWPHLGYPLSQLTSCPQGARTDAWWPYLAWHGPSVSSSLCNSQSSPQFWDGRHASVVKRWVCANDPELCSLTCQSGWNKPPGSAGSTWSLFPRKLSPGSSRIASSGATMEWHLLGTSLLGWALRPPLQMKRDNYCKITMLECF